MTFQSALIIVSLLTLLINIPFGYWRANVKKFSLQWYFAIHLPVPVIVLMRIFGGIGFHWSTYVALVAAYFLGQFLGGRVFTWRSQNKKKPLTSCLVMDIYRCYI
jgi:hypothetical protein